MSQIQPQIQVSKSEVGNRTPSGAAKRSAAQSEITSAPLRVLLVEDNEDHAALIQAHLRRGQGDGVKVKHVERLADGLAWVASDGADAVLLDMMLPDSAGIETVSRFHAGAPHVPIVVLTSAEGEQYGIEALQKGAEDYIFKGAVDAQNLIRSLRYAIERSGRRHAETALDTARQEMRIAQTIQQGLYPRSAPPVEGFEIAGVSHPAETVGGDYFDYIPMAGGPLGITVGDVSGHGIGPALLMAEARAALRTLSRTCRDVGEVMTLANQILLDGMIEGKFITLLFVALDVKTRTLHWSGAGHPDGLIFAPDGKVTARLGSEGCPLGVTSDEAYHQQGPLALPPGHLLLLYTDGVFEASPPGAMKAFGMDRFEALVAQHIHDPCEKILEAIHLAVTAHTLPGKLQDDVTAVIVRSLA